MKVVLDVLKFIDIFTLAYLIYYIITGLYALKSRSKISTGDKKHTFAVIIPARNEEKVIANLLKSLKTQNYPKELYDVFVVANNCTDKTSEIALSHNVNVIEGNENIKSKGDALKLAFTELKDSKYESFVIFDADNIVHPEFINKMNDAMCAGYEIAQGFRDSKNPSDTWVSSCYSIHYLIHNLFLNKARRNLEKSSFINGTGFMVTKNFIEKRGYDSKTLTEDIEMTVKCALYQEKIGFVEDAITYDEQVTTFNESWRQRKRWSIGTVQCFKIYSSKLIKKGIRSQEFSCMDAFVFLVSPIIQFLGILSYILHFIISFAKGQNIDYLSKGSILLIGYLISVTLSIAAVKMNKKHIKSYIKGIFMLPVFVLSWMPINLLACIGKAQTDKWEKIEHTKDVTIDKMLEKSYK